MSYFRDQLASLEFHATMLALVVPAALAGLIAIWAANSAAHWFVRILAVWGAVAVLLPIRAYEPALILSVCLSLVAGIVVLAGSLRQLRTSQQVAKHHIRFSLRDLLLVMVLVGLWLACLLQIVRGIQEFYARYFVLTCVAISATILLAFASVAGRRRPFACLMLAIAIGSSAAALTASGRAGEMDVWYLMGVRRYQSTNSYWDDVATIGLALLEVALVVALIARMAIVICRPQSAPQTRRSTPIALAATALVLLAPLAWLYWQMLWLTPLPTPFPAGPNHFAQL